METIEGNEFEDKLLTTAGKFQSSLLLPLGRCELEGWQRSYKRVTQLDDESVQLIHSNQSLHSVDTADVFETLDARVIPLSDDNSDQSSLKERLVRVFQATMNLI